MFYVSCLTFAAVTGIFVGDLSCLVPFRIQTRQRFERRAPYWTRHLSARKILVVVQFTVSISLIIGTVVILNQVQYAQQRPIGYDIDGIVSVSIRDGVMMKHFDALRDELMKTGVVEEVLPRKATSLIRTPPIAASSGQAKIRIHRVLRYRRCYA